MRTGPAMKLGACCCISMVLIPAICMMANYWSLYNTATAYTELAIDNKHTYDQCAFEPVVGELDRLGNPVAPYSSGWTQVFKFQAIMYTIIVSLISAAVLVLCVPVMSGCCLLCVNCAICPLIAAIIMTGVRVLSSNGKECSYQHAISNPETGETFADNWSTAKALFIAQCALHIPTLICFNVGL